MSEPVPCKVPDEVIYELREQASIGGGMIKVDSDTLFEMCVELELRRYDAGVEL